MLERIDRLVFYFTIECGLCHNHLNVSHVAIEEQKGALVCSLCGKPIKVPGAEDLVKSAKHLNEYLGSKDNAKFFKLKMNDLYKPADDVPAAAH